MKPGPSRYFIAVATSGAEQMNATTSVSSSSGSGSLVVMVSSKKITAGSVPLFHERVFLAELRLALPGHGWNCSNHQSHGHEHDDAKTLRVGPPFP